MKLFRILTTLVPIIALIGCATTDLTEDESFAFSNPNTYINKSPMSQPEDPKFLLLPAKIEVKWVDASGNLELDSEKSHEIVSFYEPSLQKSITSLGMTIIPYDSEVILAPDELLLKKVVNIFDAVKSQKVSQSGLGASRFFVLNESTRGSISRYSADYLVVTDIEHLKSTVGYSLKPTLAPRAPLLTTLNIGVFDLRDGQFIWGYLDGNAETNFGYSQPKQSTWDKRVSKIFESFSLK